VHIDAMDLHDPEAGCMRVFYAPGLVILLVDMQKNQQRHEKKKQSRKIGAEVK
jgi:hypothetical protein